MRILADENVHQGLIRALRDRGYSVVACAEANLVSAEDEEYIERITAEGEILLTADKGLGLLHQFSRLDSEPRVLLLRLLPFDLEEAIEKTCDALETIRRDFPTGPMMAVLQRKRLRIRSDMTP